MRVDLAVMSLSQPSGAGGEGQARPAPASQHHCAAGMVPRSTGGGEGVRAPCVSVFAVMSLSQPSGAGDEDARTNYRTLLSLQPQQDNPSRRV